MLGKFGYLICMTLVSGIYELEIRFDIFDSSEASYKF